MASQLTSSHQTARQRLGAYLLAALAVVSCPCHLPIWIAVFSGTSAGAVLGEHWGLAAVALTGDVDEAFVIGGAEIYRLAWPRCDRLYITCVRAVVQGDT